MEIIEHPAEVRLRLRAPSLGGLAAIGGRALAGLELGRDPGAAQGAWREVAVEGRDREAVLVNWLNELIGLAETERWVAAEFVVIQAADTMLRMRARGVTVDETPSNVKAATFYNLRIAEVPGGVEAEVVLDV